MNENIVRPPYKGENGLVIAIDFGTTYSGVSYTFLEKGIPPKIRSVTGFRGQEDLDSSTKVPTALVYNSAGELRAAGAEANDWEEMMVDAGEEGWKYVTWFKLLLRPKDRNKAIYSVPQPELPYGMSIEMVLGDFLGYMTDCTREYIAKTHANGDKMWANARGKATFVLSHPNGWDGFQQEKMRNAAILGGLIPDSPDGRSRVRFVSEGEASFHWCVESGLAKDGITRGNNIIVADAGGGTIDVSAFRVADVVPLRLEETRPSECRLAGSIFVTQGFEDYATEFLHDSVYGKKESIYRLKIDFDRKAKRMFQGDSRSLAVACGGPWENDEALGIRTGKFIMKRDQLAPLFEPSCRAATEAIRCQIIDNQHSTIYLVGGFAASTYLFTEIQQRLKDYNVEVKRVESHTAKAVADGAIAFFLHHYVSARVARYTYGVAFSTEYNDSLPSHRERKHLIYGDIEDNTARLPGKFLAHCTKGTVFQETAVKKISLMSTFNTNAIAHDVKLKLLAYKGDIKDVTWLDQDPGAFVNVCTFKASLPPSALVKRTLNKGKKVYWEGSYDAVVCFGTTEFKCHVEWRDAKGRIQRGPASAIWSEG